MARLMNLQFNGWLGTLFVAAVGAVLVCGLAVRDRMLPYASRQIQTVAPPVFDQKSVDGALRMMVLFDVLSDEERKRIRDAMPGPAGIRLTGPRLIIPLALFQNLARERPL